MAFNPGQFVYQPRPLQQFDFGEASRDVIQAYQERKRREQQESQYARTRSDTQTEQATDFASKQAEAAYKTQADRYQRRLALISQARAAAQGGHYNAARALMPTILELGGQATETGDPGAPDFRFEAGSEPTRGPVDIGAARRQMYQGAPPGTQANQPFQVPGFGPNGQRNPFAPQALPGAPAAALAGQQPPPAPANVPPPDAGPPPGAAKDDLPPPPGIARSVAPAGAVWLPPGMDPGPQPEEAAPPEQTSAEADLAALNAVESEPEPGDAAAAPAGQAAPEDLTGPNPFDPYVIRTSDVQANNERQLEPFFRGLKNAAPSRYSSQVEQFGKGARALHLSPEETLEATKGWSDQMIRMLNAEVTAEGQASRADAMAAQRQSVQDDKDRRDARKVADGLIRVNNLQDTNKKAAAAREAGMLAKRAETNGSVANALIESLYKMRNTGVMTDVDFSRTESGIQGIYGAIVNNTLKQFIDQNGGLHPAMVRRIQELINLTEQAHRATLMDSVGALHRAYQGANSQAARDVYRETIENNFGREMWPEEFTKRQPGGYEIPTYDPEKTGQFDSTEMPSPEEGGPQLDPRSYDPTDGPPPLGDDNLGVAPLPKEPNRTGAVRGSRVPPKPPRKKKTVAEMTPAERAARADELIRKANEP